MRFVFAITFLSVALAWAAPQKDEFPPGALARLGATVAPAKNEPRTGEVNALLFIDDNTLLSCTNSGWTTWDVQKRQTRQPKPIGGLAFAAIRDAERLWIGSTKKLHAIEPPQSALAEPAQSWDSASDQVNVIANAPISGRFVFSAGDQKLTVLNTKTGKTTGTVELTSRPVTASLNCNGRVLAVVTRDGAARHYNFSANGSIDPIWTKRVARSDHGSAGFSPDGRLYAVASAGRIMILDSTTGRALLGLERRFGEGDVRCLTISGDGRLIASGSNGPEAVVRVWAFESGQELASFKGHLGDVNAVAFSPDGKILASGGSDRGVLLWKIPPGVSSTKSIPLNDAWDTLDSLDAAEAYKAMGSLLADPKAGVATLDAGFRGLAGEQKKMLRWIAELDHEEFRAREAARRALLKTGLRAAAYLTDPKRKLLGAEGETRVRLILEAFESQGLRQPEGGLFGEQLRAVRAVRVLESFGNAEAKAILEEAAKGGADLRLTREAKGALETWPTQR